MYTCALRCCVEPTAALCLGYRWQLNHMVIAQLIGQHGLLVSLSSPFLMLLEIVESEEELKQKAQLSSPFE